MNILTRHRSVVVKTAAATLLATAAFHGVSYGQLLKIGVNFIGRNSDQFLGIDDTAGVFAQQDWNNLIGNDSYGVGAEANRHLGNDYRSENNFGPHLSLPLFTDNGASGSLGTSNVTFSAEVGDAWSSDGPTGTTNEKLMKGVLKTGNALNTPRTLTLNNLPTGFLYNFVVYTSTNDGEGDTKMNLGLTGSTAYDTYYIREVRSFDGTFTQGTNTVNNDANRTPNTDYVQWSNVAPNGSGVLTLNFTYAGDSDGAGIAGFQLIQLAPPSGPDKFWNVAGTGTWDNASTNWRSANTDAASDAVFSSASNDKAFFGNLNTAGPRTVNVDAGGVTTSEINVNNSVANSYTIQGGAIGGLASQLVKDGPGSLTMAGDNTFSGDTRIKHGTVNVTTIGDGVTPGNLGQSSGITIGDSTGSNDAKLVYNGTNGSWSRTVTVSSNGGEFQVTNGAATVTLTGGLAGAGLFTKSGNGALAFTGSAGGFSGGIAVSGGSLAVRQLGVGAGGTALSVSNGAGFAYTGSDFRDTRMLTVGTGGATVTVSDAATRYSIGAANIATNNLTVSGSGRFVIGGAVNMLTNPTINAGATLVLANETGGNVLPGTISIPSGTLEIAPSAAGSSALTLSGGTTRLGHEGLQGYYYAGTYDQGTWQNAMGGVYRSVASSFTALGLPGLAARTNTGGQLNLDFNNNNGSDQTPPFGNQGNTAADNVRTAFAGKILITSAGLTTFFTTSDDGSSIFIDGQRVVNNNAFQGMTERSGTINLSAGLHDILVTFYEGTGGAGLIANYTPAGGVKQAIPNSVLYAGDVYNSTLTNISVTADSGLEIGSAVANVGTLSQNVNTTLTVTGSANFTGTTLNGSGNHTINTPLALGSVNLGPITGAASNTITKTGNGALVFSSTAPTGLTINDNAGLVVIQALNDGVNPQNDPLAGATVNLNGGGLGFSAAPGTVAPLTYTNNVSSTNDFRISAGSYNDNVFTAVNIATINWNPAGGAVNIASGKTATFDVNNPGFTLNVGATVTGNGTLVLEQGNVNFSSTVAAPGGLTVQAATANVTGAINTGALNVSGSFAGVTSGDFNTPDIGNLHAFSTVNASSVSMTGRTLTIDGILTNTGAFTQTRGTTNLNASSSHASVAVSGGSLTTGALTSTGALAVSGGSATINGAASASNITVSTNGSLTLKGNVNSAGGATITNGRTMTFDPGTGNTSVFTGGTVNIDNAANVIANSGVTDMSGSTIHVVTPLVQTTTANALFAAQLATNVGVRAGDANGVNSTLALAPSISTMLPNTSGAGNNGGIDFPNGSSDNIFNAFFGAGIPDQFTAYFTGTFKAKVAGTHNFRFTDNDDYVILIADTNGNGVFDSGDDRRNQGCCGGDQSFGVNLTAGQEIKIGWFVDDTGGNSGLKGYFQEPSGTFTTSTIVRPGDAAQAGYWSYTQTNGGGGSIQVQSGAELRVKSFESLTSANLTSGSTLRVANNSGATASSTGTINLTGTTPSATVQVGDNNTVTAGRLTLVNNGTLTFDKAPGSTTGGVVDINGIVPGIVGAATSNIGTSNVNVQGGTVLVDAPISGTGTITASIAGILGGNSTIQGPVAVNGGGTLAPGGATLGTAIGTLGTGNLNLNGGTLKLDITSTASYDKLTVTGSVLLTSSPVLQLSLLSLSGNVGDVFYIVNNDASDPISGTFNGLADQSTFAGPNGSQFQISYDAIFGGAFDTGGNDVALKLVTIPEPGSIFALLGSTGMLIGLQRFRRRGARA